MNDFHLVHLGSFAVKGAGLIIMEATAVVPEGRISPDDSGIWSDEHIGPIKRIAEFIKSQGSVPGMQIAHAGRKADMSSPWKGYRIVPESEGGWPNDVRGPSDGVRFDENHPNPRALSTEEIQELVQKFADAAVRADKAGIQVIEVHSAHGYVDYSGVLTTANMHVDTCYTTSCQATPINVLTNMVAHLRIACVFLYKLSRPFEMHGQKISLCLYVFLPLTTRTQILLVTIPMVGMSGKRSNLQRLSRSLA